MTLQELAEEAALIVDPSDKKFHKGVADVALAVRLEEAKKDIKQLQSTLDFRIACDSVYLEGILARQVGFDAEKNPYMGDGERHGFRAGDLWVPWMLGWRAADAQDATDEIVAAARAATRDGTVIPACPSGENLRAAVERLVANEERKKP